MHQPYGYIESKKPDHVDEGHPGFPNFTTFSADPYFHLPQDTVQPSARMNMFGSYANASTNRNMGLPETQPQGVCKREPEDYARESSPYQAAASRHPGYGTSRSMYQNQAEQMVPDNVAQSYMGLAGPPQNAAGFLPDFFYSYQPAESSHTQQYPPSVILSYA